MPAEEQAAAQAPAHHGPGEVQVEGLWQIHLLHPGGAASHSKQSKRKMKKVIFVSIDITTFFTLSY